MNLQQTNQSTTMQPTKPASLPSIWFSRRFSVIVVLFVCYLNTAFVRFNISIAVVEMTSIKKIEIGNSTEILPAEFDWDSKIVGIILSIFYYGGLMTFFGGYVVTRLGGAISCALSLMLSGITTSLHPISLSFGFYPFLACRLLTGLSESFLIVSISEICSKWIPANEKSKLMSFVLNGFNVGVAIVHSFCGFLANGWGWPMIFYATGATSVITSFLCFILVKNQPSEDKWISEEELEYIKQRTTGVSKEKVIHPYKKIVSSSPVWAILTTRFTLMWILTILIQCLPLYVKDVTGENIKKVGVISSIPNIITMFTIPICGIVLDYRKNFNISETMLHKILVSGSFLVSTVVFVSSVYISNFIVTLISFVFIQMLGCIVSLVSQIIIISIAPNSTSVIAGLGTFVFSLSSILSRSITGFMITNHSLQEWNNCFILTSGISLLGAVIFILYGSSEAQSWSVPSSDENENQCDSHHENGVEKY